MKNDISILDCTLRDGGYVNDWNFGESAIRSIILKLAEAGIEVIECGFLSQTKRTDKNSSIFYSIDEINDLLQHTKIKSNLACMINFGEYNIDDLPSYSKENIVDTIRVAYHKAKLAEALDFCGQVKEKGYKTFIQPMVTANYDKNELQFLITKTNEIKPDTLYIVDSFGTMRENTLITLFKQFDESIDKLISIGFHSHNNLQLSFSNSQKLIQENCTRKLFIDSSVFGMGRGAGNLCTELLTLYLNEKTDKNYKTIPILEIIDDFLNPIFIKLPWGYSVPFYIASVNNCHPNYASFLLNKGTLSVKAINFILSQISMGQKQLFDQTIIEQLYLDYQKYQIDDILALKILKEYIGDRNLLIISPGKSIDICQNKIREFIDKENPLVISVNFIPLQYNPDVVFVSNLKRFERLIDLNKYKKNKLVIATSNLFPITNENYYFVNYASLINMDSKETDNAGMMILKLLQILKKDQVTLAGFDGYVSNVRENYYSEDMIISQPSEALYERNKNIKEQIKQYQQTMHIDFLTPSQYTE
jgi:4-hydroxy 2-oxovalerate aldolase